MLAMDRMQAFDAETGLLTCEAGVLLADILATFAPRGWFPPVVPGTRFVTVGGMIAADVHGKNHHRDGTFGASAAEAPPLEPRAAWARRVTLAVKLGREFTDRDVLRVIRLYRNQK